MEFNETEGDAQKGRVLLLYREPFYSLEVVPTFQRVQRQSVWQSLKIIEAFNELGYGVDVVPHDGPVAVNDISNYDILMGVNPNFKKIAKKADCDVLKIYFDAAMHWSQRNSSIREEYDEFNAAMGTDLEPKRIVEENNAAEISDAIIVIGDDFTRKTYANHADGSPIYNIELSTFEHLQPKIHSKDFDAASQNFLWLSGSGLVFKGLWRVLQAFSEEPNLHLHVCAPLEYEPEFFDLFREHLLHMENIHTHGWVDLGGEKFEELTKMCGFTISPSVTEGQPGGIIHSMRCGLIPIVTKEVLNETDGWGLQLESNDIEHIRKKVNYASELSQSELQKMAKKTSLKAKNSNSRETFESRIQEILSEVLENV